MKIELTLLVDGQSRCVYEVIVPESDEPDSERMDHAQRVLQSAIEMGCSLMDAPFRVTGKTALPVG